MQPFKAIRRYAELCDLIRGGATLQAHRGVWEANYWLSLTQAQKTEHGFAGTVVSKTIGRKFSNESTDIVNKEAVVVGHTRDFYYTYKK